MTRKVALITGGSKGLGRATALQLAEQGYDVVVNFSKDEAAATETVALVEQHGVRGLALQANVGSKESVQAMFAAMRDQGIAGVDVIVHAAVHAVPVPLLQMPDAIWQEAFHVNVNGLLYVVQEAASYMSERGFGRVVAVSSAGASVAMPFYAAIGVTKSAMESLVRYLAADLGKAGITVNTVTAGPMDTEAFRNVFSVAADHVLGHAAEQIAAPRPFATEDAAKVIASICGEEFAMINGQNIVVDGGLSIKV